MSTIYAIRDRSTGEVTYELDVSGLHEQYKQLRFDQTGQHSSLTYEQFASDVLTLSMQEILDVEIKPVPDTFLKQLSAQASEAAEKARKLKLMVDELVLQALRNPDLKATGVEEIVKTSGSPAKKFYALAKADPTQFSEEVRTRLYELKHTAIHKTILLKSKTASSSGAVEAKKIELEVQRLNDEITEDLDFENKLIEASAAS